MTSPAHVLKWIKPLIFIMLVLWCASSFADENKNTCPDEAQLFWMKFRSAVLNNDMLEIIAATRFPVKISQTLDDGEVTYITEKFTEKFNNLLKADPGLYQSSTTMASLINGTPSILNGFCNSGGNQLYVGAWVFDLTPEGWRLVQVFVDE